MDATVSVSQIIADSKTIGPKESIADAVMQTYPNVDIAKISETLEVPEGVIARIIQSDSFKSYFKRRVIQKGFDGIRQQEATNELEHTVIAKLRKKVNSPEFDKYSALQMAKFLMEIQKAARYKSQTETLQEQTYSNRKRLDNPDEIGQRLSGTIAGQTFFKKIKAKALTAEIVSNK